MRILVIGQTSLHWGRMEYGNIGNYYVVEPFFRQLKRVFPGAEVVTTLQMTDEFCLREGVGRLPIELYYSWDDDRYLQKAMHELSYAEVFRLTGKLFFATPFIKEVLKADLVVDLSGDIWSDNANFAGPNRFMVGLLKDRVAQLLGKKTVMLSGSPGPFKNQDLEFTKEVYKNFDLVTNRESVSSDLLEELSFDTTKTKSFACPAFIFEPAEPKSIEPIIEKYGLDDPAYLNIGFILCGWNLLVGPYDREDIIDAELLPYVEMLEKFLQVNKDIRIICLSHSNGFHLPPNFEVIHGRDFPFAKQIYTILKGRGRIPSEQLVLVTDLLSPKDTKAFIGRLDMLITGRIHAAVAALSQAIPTVIIDYGHEPKAHKLLGFAKVAGVEDLVVDPHQPDTMFRIVKQCYQQRLDIHKKLVRRITIIEKQVKASFDLLREVINIE